MNKKTDNNNKIDKSKLTVSVIVGVTLILSALIVILILLYPTLTANRQMKRLEKIINIESNEGAINQILISDLDSLTELVNDVGGEYLITEKDEIDFVVAGLKSILPQLKFSRSIENPYANWGIRLRIMMSDEFGDKNSLYEFYISDESVYFKHQNSFYHFKPQTDDGVIEYQQFFDSIKHLLTEQIS